jgi:hypothetical protein
MLSELVTRYNSDVDLQHDPNSGRGLRAKRAFEVRFVCYFQAQKFLISLTDGQPGELIFTERPLLHTAHPVARALDLAGSNSHGNLALDWQRLLHLYAYFRRTPNPSASPTNIPGDDVYPSSELLDLAMAQLSTAGVTSAPSQATDPERLPEYREAAEQWVKRYKESRKNAKKKAAAKRRKAASPLQEPSPAGAGGSAVEWSPSVEEIERLIAILETNSHSRDEEDQQDLNDPSVYPPTDAPSASKRKVPTPGDDAEGDEKDEACGLWLVASMANHSCRPNCTIHIPASSKTHDTPQLHLRCIRPIGPGDELTISYHDEEFMPTEDRQALLSSRGFTCQCPLCSGAIPDRARAAACSGCKVGVCSPLLVSNTSSWKCDQCTRTLSAQEADAVVNAEEDWLVQWPALIETVESGKTPSIKSQPYRLLRSLADMTRKTRVRPSIMLVAMPDAEKVVAPLHVCHGHVYTLLKWALFQQSVWLRTQLGRDGVVGALFAMAAIVERSFGADAASEERRVLGYWVAKESVEVLRAQADLRDEERARWEAIREEGLTRWQEGMRLLYGRVIDV